MDRKSNVGIGKVMEGKCNGRELQSATSSLSFSCWFSYGSNMIYIDSCMVLGYVGFRMVSCSLPLIFMIDSSMVSLWIMRYWERSWNMLYSSVSLLIMGGPWICWFHLFHDRLLAEV